jgi:hypothetical protein
MKTVLKRKKGKKESTLVSGFMKKPKGNGIKEGFCRRAMGLCRNLLADGL